MLQTAAAEGRHSNGTETAPLLLHSAPGQTAVLSSDAAETLPHPEQQQTRTWKDPRHLTKPQ